MRYQADFISQNERRPDAEDFLALLEFLEDEYRDKPVLEQETKKMYSFESEKEIPQQKVGENAEQGNAYWAVVPIPG